MVTGARRSKSKAASVIDSNRPRWRVRHRSTPGSQPVPFRTMDRSLSHVNTSHEGVAFTLRRPSESRPYRHLWAVSTGVEVSTFTPLLGRSPTEASQCRLLVPGRRRFGQKASRSTASAWRHRLHSKASPTLRTVAVESDPGTTVPEKSVATLVPPRPVLALPLGSVYSPGGFVWPTRRRPGRTRSRHQALGGGEADENTSSSIRSGGQSHARSLGSCRRIMPGSSPTAQPWW
jgi:hypothetical protein